MEYSRASVSEGSGIHRSIGTASGSFCTDKTDRSIRNKIIESAHCIRAASDTCHNAVRKTSLFLLKLCLNLSTDYLLEVTDHLRVRMRPHYGADAVKGCFDICTPVAHCLIYCILESSGSTVNRDNLGTEKLHSVYIK